MQSYCFFRFDILVTFDEIFAMSNTISYFKKTRNHLYQMIDKLTEKQCLYIPKGFNNNIYWNVAHCVVTQQLLVYYLSGNEMKIDAAWIENFKKGTKPNSDFFEFSKKELLDLIITTTDAFIVDKSMLIESSYNSYTTSYGVTIESVSQAVAFNNIHEVLHLGYAMALRKLVL